MIDDCHEKIADLSRFCGYAVERRCLEFNGQPLELVTPKDYEQLLDTTETAARFAEDEYMPYWGDLWPAGLLLADEVASWETVDHRPPEDRPTVLELGCGLGLVALLASRGGYRVTASDYETDALAFLVESAQRNRIAPPEIRSLDWRETYPELSFDRIVAADVTYETRSIRPVAEFIQLHLRPDGFAVISDANRTTADAFEGIARHCGLSVRVRRVERAGEHAGDDPIQGRLFELRHKS